MMSGFSAKSDVQAAVSLQDLFRGDYKRLELTKPEWRDVPAERPRLAMKGREISPWPRPVLAGDEMTAVAPSLGKPSLSEPVYRDVPEPRPALSGPGRVRLS